MEAIFADQPRDVQQDIDSLVWLGHIEDVFEFAGHTFTMRTLKGDEELAAAVVIKQYSETFGQARAWAWSRIALSLVAIDGDTTFCPPIGPDKIEFARARFNYVTSRWHYPLAEVLYAYYLELEARSIDAIRAAENLSERGRMTSMPSVDFSTEQDDSAEAEPNSIDSNTDS